MDKMQIYDAVRSVPDTAKKEISAGRLKGMTDINPMWRIKMLTEQFGPVGVGWYYTIDRTWLENGAGDVVTAHAQISLYIKADNEWSKPIIGIGGSKLVEKETKGLYTNDECYKMALTDALSVACKALGMGADVYWNKDNTKYNDIKKENFNQQTPPQFNAVNDELPFSEEFEECCECHKQVSAKMAKLCEEKYGFVVCSEDCKNKHELRKAVINGDAK